MRLRARLSLPFPSYVPYFVTPGTDSPAVSVTQQFGSAAQLSNRWSFKRHRVLQRSASVCCCTPMPPLRSSSAILLRCATDGYTSALAAALRAARRSSHECLSALIASAPSVNRTCLQILRIDLTLVIPQKEKRAAKVARSAAAVKVKPFGFASKKSSFWPSLRSAQKSIFPRKTLTSTTPWAEKAALFSFSFFFSVFLSFLFFREITRVYVVDFSYICSVEVPLSYLCGQDVQGLLPPFRCGLPVEPLTCMLHAYLPS